MSSRQPATSVSCSGSPPASRTRRLRNASSCCAFTSAADARGCRRSMRRVRSMRSPTMSPILVRAHRPPDFLRQLLADHPPLPHAAAPQRKRHDQQERQEDRELEQAADHEGLEKPEIGERRSCRGGGSPAAAPASAANSGSALLSMCAAMASDQARHAARAMRSQRRRVCSARPRKRRRCAVNIACPPSPNRA